MKSLIEKAYVRSDRKPNRRLYILLIILFLLILMLLCDTEDAKAVSIITGIGGGGIASVIVAWLMDRHDCDVENDRATATRYLYFGELAFDLEGTLRYISTAVEIEGEGEHNWYEWIMQITDDIIPVTGGAKDLQREKIKKTREDITRIQEQQLSVLSLGLISQDEMEQLLEIRTTLIALDSAFVNEVERYYLNLVAKELYEEIQKTPIVAYINERQFEL